MRAARDGVVVIVESPAGIETEAASVRGTEKILSAYTGVVNYRAVSLTEMQ